jgi:hypothetical protein
MTVLAERERLDALEQGLDESVAVLRALGDVAPVRRGQRAAPARVARTETEDRIEVLEHALGEIAAMMERRGGGALIVRSVVLHPLLEAHKGRLTAAHQAARIAAYEQRRAAEAAR